MTKKNQDIWRDIQKKKRDIRKKKKLKITFPPLISPKKKLGYHKKKNLDITFFFPKSADFWHKTAISIGYLLPDFHPI